MMSLPLPLRHTAGLVTLVVPAKDEEAAIGDTLRSLPLSTLAAAGFATEVVVLDGASADRTAAIARAHGARVIGDVEDGKGSALRNARPHFAGDYIVMLDADGTYATDAIPSVLDPLAWGEADVVMGRRRPQSGAMSHVHRFGNRVLSLGASMLYARRCPDVCTGLWGFRQDALRALPLKSRGFELEAEMFALASRLGMRVAHVPVDYLPRSGVAKLSAGRDGMRILSMLLKVRFASLAPRASRAVPLSASRLPPKKQVRV
ncbi:MAG: glycosyltransferase family 2 protein [Thermoplasmatota archaeon]